MPTARMVLQACLTACVLLAATRCAAASPVNPLLIHEPESRYGSMTALALAIGGTQSIGRAAPTNSASGEFWAASVIDPGTVAPPEMNDPPARPPERRDAGEARWRAESVSSPLPTPADLFARLDYAATIGGDRRAVELEPWLLTIPELSTSAVLVPALAAMLMRRRRSAGGVIRPAVHVLVGAFDARRI